MNRDSVTCGITAKGILGVSEGNKKKDGISMTQNRIKAMKTTFSHIPANY